MDFVGLVSTLNEARAAVDFATKPTGWADEESYVVLPQVDQYDDLVYFVDKADGLVHYAVYFDVMDRLGKMERVIR